jgi:hypothetical protein
MARGGEVDSMDATTFDRPRRLPRRGPPPKERRVHIALAKLIARCKRDGWWFSCIPSGEYRTDETGALLKAMGLQPGMFDFILIGPTGEHYWLELKRDWRAPLSIDQLRFRRELQRRSIPHGVATSFDEAVGFLTTWGALEGVHVQ